MTSFRLEFGYYPHPLRIEAGPIAIAPLPDIGQIVADLESSEGIDKEWIYAPPQQTHVMGRGVRTLPFPSRVFGLPKTHVIEHAAADSEDQLTFHLWALSFFTGTRLTATPAGFLDATPLKPGKLVDFVLWPNSMVKAVELADAFWTANRNEPLRSQQFAAAVHALFLGQNPLNLQFESFVLLYMAFDACFALAQSLQPSKPRVAHADRLRWMCNLLGMVTPPWADQAASSGPAVAALRNATIHEALFMGQPLGFAVHGAGTNQNLTLEMQALICRFLVALLGGARASYVQSAVHTRQRHALELS